MTRRGVPARLGGAALMVFALSASAARAQGTPAGARPLSLVQALEMAEGASESDAIARAGLSRARGQQLQERSARLPHAGGTLAYSRTLASDSSAPRSPWPASPP